MPSTRIFVGGLSDEVDRQELGGKLSRYAPVLNIELKEKTDPEGNVMLRFAYVNIDADPSQVQQCIQQLNGASWKGSRLRVERAKESFLDRLKREREARRQEDTYYWTSDNLAVNYKKTNTFGTEENSVHSIRNQAFQEQTSVENDTKYSKKRKESITPEENHLSLRKSDEISQTDSLSHVTGKEKKKKKDEVEEKILSSFKQFSSFWADSDNENDEGGCGVPTGLDESQQMLRGGKTLKPNKLEGRTMQDRGDQNEDTDATVDEDDDTTNGYISVRDEQHRQLSILESLDNPHKYASKVSGGDGAAGVQGVYAMRSEPPSPHKGQAALDKPTTHETMLPHQETKAKYVKVSKDLTFGQNTSGFSLLAQFSMMNKEEDGPEVEKEEVVAAPVSVLRSLITVHPKVKRRSFFIHGDDPEIADAIKWMTQPITEEVTKEFEEALPALRQVIKTRSFRAKKDEADPRMQRRGRGQGRGQGRGLARGQGRGRPAGDDSRNPYRDHRWRERDVKK